MNLFKEISLYEVYPALGCTEPASCAYAAAVAAYHLEEPVEFLELLVDPGTYKNGAGVVIPNTNGLKGNLIACTLGAMIADKDLKLQTLQKTTSTIIQQAKNFIKEQRAIIKCGMQLKNLYIEVTLISKSNQVSCIIEHTHTHITKIIKNDIPIYKCYDENPQKNKPPYKETLKNLKIQDFLESIKHLDQQDFEYIKKGIEINIELSKHGDNIGKTAFQLKYIKDAGILSDDISFKIKHAVASAIDARMGGVNLPAMTSGGSGNQGIITTLIPYYMGIYFNIEEKIILKSIAFAHILNAYIKAHIGELSVICGCAISAGIAASCAIVYQHAQDNLKKIMLTVNNVLGDLSGLICDGAKFGCSMKALSSVDSVIRSSLMAIKDYGLTPDDGLISFSIEETIKNLSKIIFEGMSSVDPTLIKILESKKNEHLHKKEIYSRKRSAVY